MLFLASFWVVTSACGGGTETVEPPAKPAAQEQPAQPAEPAAADPKAAATEEGDQAESAAAVSDQMKTFVDGLDAELRKRTNPLTATPEQLSEAATTFGTACASCHGVKGAGDGPAAAALTPAPANFGDAGRMGLLTDGERFEIIKKGVPGTAMVGLGAAWSDDQVWAMLRHIEGLGAKQ
jgi:mono/diheme cytochrome c family protein